MTMKMAKVLVVDSAPIIKGARLDQMGEELFTIQEVVKEIRDERAKANLAAAIDLYGLKIKIPSDESIAAVTHFAKLTGDLASVSRTDLKVLALAWMLEKERNGMSNLRSEPKKAGQDSKSQSPSQPGQGPSKAAATPATRPSPIVSVTTQPKTWSSLVKGSSSPDTKSSSKPQLETNAAEDNFSDLRYWSSPLPDIEIDMDELDLHSHSPQQQQQSEQKVPQTQTNNEPEAFNDLHFWSAPIPDIDLDDALLSELQSAEPGQANNMEEGDQQILVYEEQDEEATEGQQGDDEESKAQSDDGEGEWITPTNVAKIKLKHQGGGGKEDTQVLDVACVTTDFAMQNIILQIGLKLVSIDGNVIKKLKSWVLRCHACFHVTKDVEKKFCPRCGNSTLMRTSVTVNSDGIMTLYLKKNFQYNNRGTKYSIPTIQGGRSNNDLILREDQKEYERAAKQRAKGGPDPFDLDFMPLERSKQGFNGMPVIGHGRKNVNEVKGRRRKR